MTDVIDRVHGQAWRRDGGRCRFLRGYRNRRSRSGQHRLGPIQVFVAILLGSNAVLLMANVSHLSGWRAGVAIAVAWVEIGLGVACVARAVRPVVGLAAATSLLSVGLWLSMHTVSSVPHSVMWVGVGLAAAALATSLALFQRLIGGQLVVVDAGAHLRGSGRCGHRHHGRAPRGTEHAPPPMPRRRRPAVVCVGLGGPGSEDHGRGARRELKAVQAGSGREHLGADRTQALRRPLVLPTRPS